MQPMLSQVRHGSTMIILEYQTFRVS